MKQYVDFKDVRVNDNLVLSIKESGKTVEAIKKAGYVPGKHIFLGMDVASSEFYDPETKIYELKKSGQERKQALN